MPDIIPVSRKRNAMIIWTCSWLMLASVFCKSANAMDWWGVTEDFPPYNYVEDKKPTGFATEVVQQLMAKLDEDIRIDVLPWTRAMLTAESRPDTLIFSILRTDTRENKYHWIGQIDNLSIYLSVAVA